jgi:hypothetical protein
MGGLLFCRMKLISLLVQVRHHRVEINTDLQDVNTLNPAPFDAQSEVGITHGATPSPDSFIRSEEGLVVRGPVQCCAAQ